MTTITRHRAADIRSTLSGVAFSGEPPTADEIAALNLPSSTIAQLDTMLPAVLDARAQGHNGEARRLANYAAERIVEQLSGERANEPEDADIAYAQRLHRSTSPVDSDGNVHIVSTSGVRVDDSVARKPCAWR